MADKTSVVEALSVPLGTLACGAAATVEWAFNVTNRRNAVIQLSEQTGLAFHWSLTNGGDQNYVPAGSAGANIAIQGSQSLFITCPAVSALQAETVG